MAILQLIRWKNLLIILCTQMLVWACVVLPLGPQVLTAVNAILITLSTVLIAAAGYIINDYFDNKIDAINKPEKVVLGRAIPRKKAIIYHSVLNGVALLLAAIVAHRWGHYQWLLLQAGCTLLLWLYSTHFKRQLITGNLVVALLTGLTLITLIVYEPRLYYFALGMPFEETGDGVWLLNPAWLLIYYTLFAFLLTWMREIVKDMEDMEGDADQGCVTVPIKWGLQGAARFAQILGATTVVCLLSSGIRLLNSDHSAMGIYILAIIVPALTVWIVRLNRQYTKEHYLKMSSQLKVIMVLGLGSLVVNIVASLF